MNVETTILNSFGLTNSWMTHEIDYPEPVPGRVALIDADFIAYHVWNSYVTPENDVNHAECSDDKMIDTLEEAAYNLVNHYTKLARAHKSICYCTIGDHKSGKHEQAIQAPYQGTRIPKESWYLLHIKRELHNGDDKSTQYEADDLVGIAAHANPNCIIVSPDKDLRMIPGIHYDIKHDCEFVVETWGEIALVDGKLIGTGEKWFWAQMLMGDPVDNIKGLPYVYGDAYYELMPTKEWEKLWKDPVRNESRLLQLCECIKRVGPVLTYNILKNIHNREDAIKCVSELYSRITEFTHHETGDNVEWQDVLISEAKLLWIKRTLNENDVLKWISF